MRLFVLAFTAVLALPAEAATTVLDFSGNICGATGDQACGNGSIIGQFYGSSAEASVLWRALSNPGNSPALGNNVNYWGPDYADLVDVAYSSVTGEAGIFAGAGKTVTLDSVDVGGWPNTARNSSVRVYDLNYNVLYDSGLIQFPGTTSATLTIGVSSAIGLIFQWGPDSFNGGIDNLTFTVRDSGPVIPEPGTWAMMIAGFGLVGAAARRRKIATA
jgi:hypothetical protein